MAASRREIWPIWMSPRGVRLSASWRSCNSGKGAAWRNAVNVILPVIGLGLVIFYQICDTACSALQGKLLGVDLKVVGILFMVANGPISTALLRVSDPLVLGIGSAGLTGNVLLAGVVVAAVGVGAKLRADRALRASV